MCSASPGACRAQGCRQQSRRRELPTVRGTCLTHIGTHVYTHMDTRVFTNIDAQVDTRVHTQVPGYTQPTNGATFNRKRDMPHAICTHAACGMRHALRSTFMNRLSAASHFRTRQSRCSPWRCRRLCCSEVWLSDGGQMGQICGGDYSSCP